MPIEIKVPDIGDHHDVEIIEVSVQVGDCVAKDDTLLTLETDKATMDIPSPEAGVVTSLNVSVGDKVSEGSLILLLQSEQGSESTKGALDKTIETTSKEEDVIDKTSTVSAVKQLVVPDIGSDAAVEVIEVHCQLGDVIDCDAPLVTLESDKASMEVPSLFKGKILSLDVKVGDKFKTGALLGTIEVTEEQQQELVSPKIPTVRPEAPNDTKVSELVVSLSHEKPNQSVYAGPGVRRFARELGVSLQHVKGTGRKGRILKENVQAYVKAQLSQRESSQNGLQSAPLPDIDFSKFGEVTIQPLSRIKKLSGQYLHRNWVHIPHVTQFEEADITELESFRKGQKALAEKQGIKLTPLVFLMKAAVAALKAFPTFNASLNKESDALIMKNYFHIGIAVDTPNGLVVPVVRNVDKKGLFQLAKELSELSAKAREGKLTAEDMKGGCFSISSLGGIGGTAFTPIVNLPEVAILGVSKSQMKPIYTGTDFQPRLMLPLSLSYDHRVIDGAEAARFAAFLAHQLSDIRRLLL